MKKYCFKLLMAEQFASEISFIMADLEDSTYKEIYEGGTGHRYSLYMVSNVDEIYQAVINGGRMEFDILRRDKTTKGKLIYEPAKAVDGSYLRYLVSSAD